MAYASCFTRFFVEYSLATIVTQTRWPRSRSFIHEPLHPLLSPKITRRPLYIKSPINDHLRHANPKHGLELQFGMTNHDGGNLRCLLEAIGKTSGEREERSQGARPIPWKRCVDLRTGSQGKANFIRSRVVQESGVQKSRRTHQVRVPMHKGHDQTTNDSTSNGQGRNATISANFDRTCTNGQEFHIHSLAICSWRNV